jgi:uncharacterized protein (DUF1330 family)/catechol 2,3-dioxygenase-like lactoylglutathione lyase family enzyme
MRYYGVAQIEITDPSWTRDYVRNVTAMVERRGGRYLARTQRVERVERLEGDRQPPPVVLLIEWPSKQVADAFYDSEEYRPYREQRLNGSRGEFFLVAGEDASGVAQVPGQDRGGASITLRQVVLDCTDARALAEFYRQLLGLEYRTGYEPPGAGQPDPRGQDWLILRNPDGGQLAFQQVAELPEATWPDGPYPQMLHLDITVATVADLDAQHERALALGARLLQDRSGDPEEPLRVYADPAGHPFCIFVAP